MVMPFARNEDEAKRGEAMKNDFNNAASGKEQPQEKEFGEPAAARSVQPVNAPGMSQGYFGNVTEQRDVNENIRAAEQIKASESGAGKFDSANRSAEERQGLSNDFNNAAKPPEADNDLKQ